MKTLLSFCISLLLLGANSTPSFSEELKKDDDITQKVSLPVQYNGLGVSAGFISGLGFSYRAYLTEKIGYKVSSAVYIDNNTSYNFMNAGLQGIYVLSDNDWMRFYAIAGVADFNYKRKNYIYDPVPAPTTDTTKGEVISKPKEVIESNNYLNLGAGIGVEIGRTNKNLSLAIELPLVMGIKDFKSIDYTYPIPQISLLYNF